MVYVLNNNGQPLMPTSNHAKVRVLLNQNKAIVVQRCPFIIKLTYDSTNYTQEITLGVDAGSKTIGMSASTNTKEMYSSEVMLRNDIVDLLSARKELRRSRRSRLRYRKVRFKNRVHSKHKGWLAPSVEQKIESHLTVIRKVVKMIPVTKIVIETASFDTQKLQNDSISGYEYQQGDMLGFWNVREYVLWRDEHECQCCHGKSKDKILNVHHIESRKTGGNSPKNLVTLCEYCHKQYHLGNIQFNIKRGKTLRDAAFMGIMRWTVYNRLKLQYCDIEVGMTYGYITKNTRIENNLSKEHRIDALCIAGHPQVQQISEWYLQKKVRCHNRQIHKTNTLKGSIRKRNQAEYQVKGYRLYDKVSYANKEYFIFGRRASGFFDIRTLDGDKVNKGSISCKKLTLVCTKQFYLTERRCAV